MVVEGGERLLSHDRPFLEEVVEDSEGDDEASRVLCTQTGINDNL